MGQIPIHKDKEECQAALSQGEHLKYQVLRAGVTFGLSHYCSLSTAKRAGRTGESYELTYFPAVCSEQEHHMPLLFYVTPVLMVTSRCCGEEANLNPINTSY